MRGTRLEFMALAAFVAVSQAGPAEAQVTYGTYGQETYEGNWQAPMEEVWRHCRKFNDRMSDEATRLFYRSLVSRVEEFEAHDSAGLDSVDLAYVLTHGAANTDGEPWAHWAMWDRDVRAVGRRMRLGNSGRGLSIFASYACDTHAFQDSNVWERWLYMFNGGLRYTVGSHGLLWWGRQTNECGREFAEDMQDGDVIKEAWRKALREPFVDQDATAIATGLDAADCHTRRDNMTLQNFGRYPRRTYSDMRHMCWTWWNNL